MDLLSIEPHKVSRDLRGYSVMFYGEVKSGKTTNASKFPNALLLAFEKGYSALPGVFAQPMNSWGDMLKVLRQLKQPEVKEKFETIVIDTVDIAYDYAEQYICNVNGVDSIGDIGFGQGYSQLAKEFDTKLRQIVQLDYGLVLISHSTDKTFTNEDGTEYNKIVPTLPNRARLITSRMCDIIGYSRQIETTEGPQTYLFMRGTPRFEAGSRFKYTSDAIPFTYDNLVNDIGDAIDKMQEEMGSDYITETRDNLHTDIDADLDFDTEMERFENTVSELIGKDEEKYPAIIQEVIERHLGIGKKVAEMTRAQVDILNIITEELRDLN